MTRPTDEELAAAVDRVRRGIVGAHSLGIIAAAAIADAEPITSEALEREGWKYGGNRPVWLEPGGYKFGWLYCDKGRWLFYWEPSVDEVIVTTMVELRTLLRIVARTY